MTDDARKAPNAKRITAAIVVGVLIVIAAPITWYRFLPKNVVEPEVAAREWAQKLKLPYRGAACTMFDSDDDGYVSCVLALDGPDRAYFQGLQCGEMNSRRGGGCKPDVKNPEVHLVLQISSNPAPAPSPKME
jgi:hypothetical protein